MIQAISIRNEQNRFAIRSPRRWQIVSVIQGEASKRAQLFALRQHLRQVNVRLKVTAEQSQMLSIARYADVRDRRLIVCNAGGCAGRPSCARIQVDRPKVKVSVVRRGLLQCIDQPLFVGPRNRSAQSKIRQDRLTAPRRRIEHVNSLSKSDRTEAVRHSDAGKSLPVRRPCNRPKVIPATIYDLSGDVLVRLNQPDLLVIPSSFEKSNL